MTKSFWSPFITLIFCFFSWSSYALQLFDGESFLYDIGPDGALQKGTLDAYAGLYHLRVNGTNYAQGIRALSPDGREVRRETFIEPGSGLEIKRNLHVSKTQNFARFSEILRNPTDAEITVNVEIYGKLGASNRTIAEQANFLITNDVIDDISGPMPVLLHYHSQPNSPIKATHTLSSNQLSWVYSDVSIPAQSQVRLIYFVAQTADEEIASQIATQIFSNPTALYENMGPNAREQLLNFKPPQPVRRDNDDEDFSNAPFLTLGELRMDILDEEDPWSFQRTATAAEAYALKLSADETVTIRLSAAFNAYLYLYQDIKGETLLASNDDRHTKTSNAEIVFTAETEGTYYIEATSHNRREYGQYALEIFPGSINQPPNAYPFEFILDSPTVPATVTLTDFSTDLDGEITERCWQFGDGTPVICDASQTITHTYEQAGQYSVGLTVRDDQGAYAHSNDQISIRSTPTGVLLRVSNSVSGELAFSDTRSQTRTNAFADRYRITSVTPGQELVIEMTSDEFDSYLYLYDQYNRLLFQDNNGGNETNARLRYTPKDSNELLVEATSLTDNTLGNYNLSLELANNSRSVPVPIELLKTANPLQQLFIARLPANFEATFLQWDFGDGSPVVSTDTQIVSHTYSGEGEFMVSMTALNALGQERLGIEIFTISDQYIAPQVRFRASPLFGEKPLRVFFQNESQPGVFGNSDDQLSYVWQFGDGEVSTDTNPAHTFTEGGTYHVTLQATSKLTQQTTSYNMPITVIDRQSDEVPVTGKARELPQVLMAGFDPILVDILDTDVKIFAIVRPGKEPIQTVRFIQNGNDFQLIMQHVATYANGDQRYETVFTFQQGTFPITTLGDLFGEQFGQFQIQAIDQAGQFQAFPNLEIGNHPQLADAPNSLSIEPLHQISIRRRQPQVLAAGFDPTLVHKNDSGSTLTEASDAELTIKAIIREGFFPIKTVTLEQNQSPFRLPMQLQETLPNGDKMYIVNFVYPSGSLETGVLGNLLGTQPGQFMITVEDSTSQTHSFPQVKIGDFSQR
jgi:PKD repeat protein